jgi:hypothetical protein
MNMKERIASISCAAIIDVGNHGCFHVRSLTAHVGSSLLCGLSSNDGRNGSTICKSSHIFCHSWVSHHPSAKRLCGLTLTTSYRHASIPQAIESMKELGVTKNIQFDNTEDPSFFTDANLTQYDALLFLMTTGQGNASRP